MAKAKYFFNQKTLSYERLKTNWKQRLIQVISFVLSTSVFAVVIIVFVYNFFGSPKERMQQRELEYMKLQYQLLQERLQNLDILLADMQERDDNIYRIIFEAEPIPSSIRRAGYGGVDRYDRLKGYKNSDIVVLTTQRLDQIASQLYVQSKSFDEVYELAKNKSEMLASIPAIQPVKDIDLRRITSYFGIRTDPFYKVNKFHQGVDFSAPTGTEVYATGNGKVEMVEKSYWGYGNTIIINHGFGYKTKYSHLQQFKVKKGDVIKRGQLIATIGNTGKSTAPHLHYEVHKNDKPVNPVHFFFNDLSPEEYQLILELSAQPSQSMD
ncbi:MAG: M23 family metallopeptidase [Bacteroidales bacterium]|nr:M23 family metallopeptidase [Bacteroidales bacterium]